MRKSKVLAKWRNNQFARFCAMGHVLPFFIRYAAHFGYDGIWLDLEHRNMDEREVQHLLALCQLFDIDCMVRPPTLQRTRLYRYLEDGATGFMVPFVSDGQIAKDLVSAVKFPPIGNRGLDGAGMDCNYGIDSWKPDSTYIEDANRETFIVAQIETPDAVRNAAEVAATPGIDALFVGPGDLGLRLSIEKPDDMTLESAVEHVASVCKEQGKTWGRTAGSIDDLKRYRDMGAQMVPWGGDFALMNVLKNASADLDSVLGS